MLPEVRIFGGLAVFAVGVLVVYALSQFELGSYVLLGWLPMLGVHSLVQALPTPLLLWIAAGGLFYTAGVAFFQYDRIRYFHAAWHVMVLAGSACHFIGIYRYCTAAPG